MFLVRKAQQKAQPALSVRKQSIPGHARRADAWTSEDSVSGRMYQALCLSSTIAMELKHRGPMETSGSSTTSINAIGPSRRCIAKVKESTYAADSVMYYHMGDNP